MVKCSSTRLAIICSFGLLSVGYAQVTLVANRQPAAVVVIADDASLTTRYAAEEIVEHVLLATGVLLPVVAETRAPEFTGSKMFIGTTRSATSAGLSSDSLESDSFWLRIIDDRVYLLGNDSCIPGDAFDFIDHQSASLGTLFAAYEFLERYVGVRWLWPGKLGTYVPKTDSIVVPGGLDEIHSPQLKFRQFRTAGVIQPGLNDEPDAVRRLSFSDAVMRSYRKDLAAYLGRHRTGSSEPKPAVGHYFHDWWKLHGRRHPDWFMMDHNGQRGPIDDDERRVALCVSNEELHRHIVDTAWDGGDIIRLGGVNRRTFCRCEACEAWDGPQPESPPEFARDDFEPRMVSDRYARFWKTIQGMAAERNPDATVTTFLYLNYFPAPIGGIRLNSNIYGEFVPWLSPYAVFPMSETAEQWLRDQWSGWQRTGIRMAFRPNYLMLGYVMPHLSTRQAGAFFKYAVEHGMEGFDQDSLVGHWAVQGPMLYVHMRLAWRPDLSIETIRQEYYNAFGPAAASIESYFDYWEDYALGRPGGNLRNPVDAHIAYPPDVVDAAHALLAEADAITRRHPSEVYQKRVQFLMAGLEHARLAARLMSTLYQGRVSWRPERFRESQAALHDLIAFRRANEQQYIANFFVAARHEVELTDVDVLLHDAHQVQVSAKKTDPVDSLSRVITDDR